MAGLKNSNARKNARRNARRKRQEQKHRGPVLRFKLSRLILLWVLSLILCFAAYIYKVNFHPDHLDRDSSVLADADESSHYAPAIPPVPEGSPDTSEDSEPDSDTDNPDSTPDESSIPVQAGPQKVNPVPESVPMSADYLNRCAFLGETNIHNLGRAGLLAPFNVYASETLTLNNYAREYIMLSGTTIRILSAVKAADCPIYLMFGTESLADHPADQTAEQFRILLNDVMAVAPEAPIYVLSIPPVTRDAEKAEKPLLNSVIDDYNSKLLDICNEENVYFIDTNTALKNNDSRLDPYYAMEDGIHLTTEAGQILLNYVLAHIPA